MAMRVLIADDHQLFREGLREVLHQFDPQSIITEAGDFDQAVAAISEDLDLALLDLTMPGDTWENGVQRIAAALPTNCRLIILSASDDQRQIRRAVEFGASGFIPKTSSSRVMMSALHLVMEGGVYLPQEILLAAAEPTPALKLGALTPRQGDVMALLSQGKSSPRARSSFTSPPSSRPLASTIAPAPWWRRHSYRRTRCSGGLLSAPALLRRSPCCRAPSSWQS